MQGRRFSVLFLNSIVFFRDFLDDCVSSRVDVSYGLSYIAVNDRLGGLSLSSTLTLRI